MKRLSIILSTIAIAFSLCVPSMGQGYYDLVKTDRQSASYIYHPYNGGPSAVTKAPEGFTPFYIAHYGRHGSRYHSGESYFRVGVAVLADADSAGILSSEGKVLRDEFMRLFREHKGMYGQLTPRGAREHREIAHRMASSFPEVFSGRSEVECVSSPIQRCIISMANFTMALKDEFPSTDYTFITGDRYFDYICHEITDKKVYDSSKHMEDSLRAAICTYDDLFGRIFSDQAAARSLVKNPQAFIRSIYMAGCICECLDWMDIDLFKYLSDHELASQATVRNNKFYGEYGGSLEWGHESRAAAHDLLMDFVKKADKALEEGSNRAADLRFGHDTGIIPLVTLMGIDGMEGSLPMAQASQMGWMCQDKVPMGSNLQMVFYHNDSGDVLVKMLYNEKETTIKAVPSAYGPYYRWSTLREYLLSL